MKPDIKLFRLFATIMLAVYAINDRVESRKVCDFVNDLVYDPTDDILTFLGVPKDHGDITQYLTEPGSKLECRPVPPEFYCRDWCVNEMYEATTMDGLTNVLSSIWDRVQDDETKKVIQAQTEKGIWK